MESLEALHWLYNVLMFVCVCVCVCSCGCAGCLSVKLTEICSHYLRYETLTKKLVTLRKTPLLLVLKKEKGLQRGNDRSTLKIELKQAVNIYI